MQNARNEYGAQLEETRDFYRALPQYRLRNRWPWKAMRDLTPWTQTKVFSLRQHCAPASGETTFADGESKEHPALLLPGSFLQMITGTSDQTAGFRVQLINDATQELMFSSDITHPSIAGGAISPFNVPAPFLLPDGGIPFPHGGKIVARMTNMATATAVMQLVLWIAEPLGGRF